MSRNAASLGHCTTSPMRRMSTASGLSAPRCRAFRTLSAAPQPAFDKSHVLTQHASAHGVSRVTNVATAVRRRELCGTRRRCCVVAEAAGTGELPVCRIRMGESIITLETGLIARQANGAVVAREGDTTLLTTLCTGESGADGTFLPLTVLYQERFSAAGRTSSGFSKRDGRARDSEVLVSRLVDRPLRPVFPEGFTLDTQILQLVLSWGGVRTADALAIIAAGAAAAVSDVPLSKPVAGVRVGWLRGASFPVINPTVEQVRHGAPYLSSVEHDLNLQHTLVSPGTDGKQCSRPGPCGHE